MKKNSDVLIVGGGIVGCSLAFELAYRHQLKVTVLEKSVPGAEASTAAAGILGAQLEAHRVPRDGGAYFRLMLKSRERHTWLNETLQNICGFGTGYHVCGSLRVSRADQLDRLRTSYFWQREYFPVEELNEQEVQKLEPNLNKGLIGLRFAEDAQVDPALLMRALTQGCARVGVQFRSGLSVHEIAKEGSRVVGVDTVEGRIFADRVAIAAGSWTSLIAGLPDGIRRVRPVRGQIVQVESRPTCLKHIVMGDTGYIVPRVDGRVFLGSTMEEVGHQKDVTVGGMLHVLQTATQLAPMLAEAPIQSQWSGFRPAVHEDHPMLGACNLDGLYFASGHYRNGILVAAESARLVADLIAKGSCDTDLGPFAIHRDSYEARASK